jgi:predicted amidohydrolase
MKFSCAFVCSVILLQALPFPSEAVAAPPLRVAIAQFDTIPGQVQRNLDTMERLAREAASNSARLVMFHELSTTDYLDDVSTALEEVPGGPSCQRIEALAKELGCYIAFGLPEKEAERRYITYAFFGPEGFVEKYRKTWLFKKVEDPGFRNEHARFDPGSGPRIFEIDGIRATCIICADADSPRCIQRVADLKPDLVFFPINRTAKTFDAYPGHVAKFGAVTLVSNRIGDSQGGLYCPGGSTIYDATGAVIAEANRDGTEEILYRDLDIQARDVDQPGSR